MNEVLKTIEKRSSTRGYTQEKLTSEEIDALVEAGLQAPTAANKQEIHITVLDSSNPILKEIEDAKNAGQTPPNNFYYDAPTVMILSGDASFPWSPVDAGIAVENIALAAEALGLGNVIIGCIKDALLGEKKEHFAKALQLPDGYQYEIAIAVGHKATEKEPHAYSKETLVTIL